MEGPPPRDIFFAIPVCDNNTAYITLCISLSCTHDDMQLMYRDLMSKMRPFFPLVLTIEPKATRRKDGVYIHKVGCIDEIHIPNPYIIIDTREKKAAVDRIIKESNGIYVANRIMVGGKGVNKI